MSERESLLWLFATFTTLRFATLSFKLERQALLRGQQRKDLRLLLLLLRWKRLPLAPSNGRAAAAAAIRRRN